MARALFIYGVACYLAGAYFIGLGGFLGNFLGPLSIDRGPAAPLVPGLLVNISLIVLFGLAHSLMARRGFKRWWATVIPRPPSAAPSCFSPACWRSCSSGSGGRCPA